MYISGIQVEKKKVSVNIKSNSRPKPVSQDPVNRPYSSEYKFNVLEKQICKEPPAKKIRENEERNFSSNKIPFRRNDSDKN